MTREGQQLGRGGEPPEGVGGDPDPDRRRSQAGAAPDSAVQADAAQEHAAQDRAAQGGEREWRVRRARPGDVPALDAMVHELAVYEGCPELVEATPDDLADALFGGGAGGPRVHAHVAEVSTAAGWDVVGMAVWYVTYSTWTGRHGVWLEDLYVRPSARGSGLGRALLAALAAECVERGHRRLEWWVLDWNAPAHAVYRAVGARPEDEWTVWRLDGDALQQLGAGSSHRRRVPRAPGVGTVGG